MKRTSQQNKAIHVYCHNVALAMNEHGFDLEAILNAKKVDVPCTPENIKDVVFKGIMVVLFPEITSTTELETNQVTKVYETMNRWLGNNFGVHVPFPSEEDQAQANNTRRPGD